VHVKFGTPTGNKHNYQFIYIIKFERCNPYRNTHTFFVISEFWMRLSETEIYHDIHTLCVRPTICIVHVRDKYTAGNVKILAHLFNVKNYSLILWTFLLINLNVLLHFSIKMFFKYEYFFRFSRHSQREILQSCIEYFIR
jgi:hypothetical protein